MYDYFKIHKSNSTCNVTFMSDPTRTAGLGSAIARGSYIHFSRRRPREAQVRFEAEDVEIRQVF
jgi:hypothetical protein